MHEEYKAWCEKCGHEMVCTAIEPNVPSGHVAFVIGFENGTQERLLVPKDARIVDSLDDIALGAAHWSTTNDGNLTINLADGRILFGARKVMWLSLQKNCWNLEPRPELTTVE